MRGWAVGAAARPRAGTDRPPSSLPPWSWRGRRRRPRARRPRRGRPRCRRPWGGAWGGQTVPGEWRAHSRRRPAMDASALLAAPGDADFEAYYERVRAREGGWPGGGHRPRRAGADGWRPAAERKGRAHAMVAERALVLWTKGMGHRTPAGAASPLGARPSLPPPVPTSPLSSPGHLHHPLARRRAPHSARQRPARDGGGAGGGSRSRRAAARRRGDRRVARAGARVRPLRGVPGVAGGAAGAWAADAWGRCEGW